MLNETFSVIFKHRASLKKVPFGAIRGLPAGPHFARRLKKPYGTYAGPAGSGTSLRSEPIYQKDFWEGFVRCISSNAVALKARVYLALEGNGGVQFGVANSSYQFCGDV